MFGCYRRNEANDPETYVVAVTALLASYEDDVILAVTDPVRGLPVQSQFVPTIKEIRDACEAFLAKQAHDAEMRRFRDEQNKRKQEWESYGLEPKIAFGDCVAAMTDDDRRRAKERMGAK